MTLNFVNSKKFLLTHLNFILSCLALFFLLILAMPPNQWHTNEEQYLGYALKTINGDFIPQFSALTDQASHRFTFEYIFGFLISQIGFEWTHALGRILVAWLYAISLTIFFRTLRLTPVASCTIILLFIWLGEDIIGREWLFQGFEPKTVAYPLVIFSFSLSLRRKFTGSYLLLALATYFHFLVGGFWFFVTAIGQFYENRNLKVTLQDILKYILICFPLIILIASNQLAHTTTYLNPQGLSADWIYSHFRAPHHVAPFASPEIFKQRWYLGVVFLGSLTATSFILHEYTKDDLKKYSKLIMVLNGYLILGLILSFFDKNGSLGKLYLARPSSIILLLTLVLYSLVLKHYLRKKIPPLNFITLILVSSLALPTLMGHNFIYARVESVILGKQPVYSVLFTVKDFLPGLRGKPLNSKLDQLILASSENEITLIAPNLERSYLDFERTYQRPTLVSHKFVPTTEGDILRWYDLLQQREELFLKGCPSSLIKDYPVRYLLSPSNNQDIDSCGEIIYEGKGRKLIEIDPNVPSK